MSVLGHKTPFPVTETNVWISPKRTFTTERANDQKSPPSGHSCDALIAHEIVHAHRAAEVSPAFLLPVIDEAGFAGKDVKRSVFRTGAYFRRNSATPASAVSSSYPAESKL